MQNNRIATQPAQATADIESNQNTANSPNGSPFKAAVAGLAFGLFSIGAGVLLVKGFAQSGKPNCPEGQPPEMPCPNHEPSFGLIAAGAGMAFGAVLSGLGACNLLQGKACMEGTAASAFRGHHHRSTLSNTGHQTAISMNISSM